MSIDRASLPEDRGRAGGGLEGEEVERRRSEPMVDLEDGPIERLRSGEQFLLTVTRSGFGKRTSAYEYRVTSRGGQGI